MPLPPASLLLTDPNEHAAAMAVVRQVLEGNASVLQEEHPPLIAAALAVADRIGESDKRVAPAHLLWYIALNKPSSWPLGEIIGAESTTDALERKPFQIVYLQLDGLLATCKTTAPVEEHVAVMARFLWDLIDGYHAKHLDAAISDDYAHPAPYCPPAPAYSPPASPPASPRYSPTHRSSYTNNTIKLETRRSSVRSFLAKVRMEELGRREAQLRTEAAADAALRAEVSALLAAAAPVMRIALNSLLPHGSLPRDADLLTPAVALVEAALRFMQDEEGDVTAAPSTEKSLPQHWMRWTTPLTSQLRYPFPRSYPLLPDPEEHASAMAEVRAALEDRAVIHPDELHNATARVAARLGDNDNDKRVARTHLLWYIALTPAPTHRIIDMLDSKHFKVNELLEDLLTACEETTSEVEEHTVAMIRFLSDIVELKRTNDENPPYSPCEPTYSLPYLTMNCRSRLLDIMVKKNTEEVKLRITELCTQAAAHAHLTGKVRVLLNSAAPVLHMAQEVAAAHAASAASAVPAVRGTDLLAPAIALVDAALRRLQEDADPPPSAGKRARGL